MILQHLEISGIRNIRQAVLVFGSGVNVLVGANGSGKSSLLEAIHVLSTGKGYRSHLPNRVITHGMAEAVVFGRIDDGGGRRTTIGVSRNRNGRTEFRISGENCFRASELAEVLPVLLIAPDNLNFLSDTPAARRKFLNWGVFHVKQGFAAAWQNAQHCLQQRNAVLKNGKLNLRQHKIWTDQYLAAAKTVHLYCLDYMTEFAPLFKSTMSELLGDGSYDILYLPGWPPSESLGETLSRTIQQDQVRGFTGFGHHRADLRLTSDGKNMIEILSRGQLKLATAIMMLTQSILLKRRTGKSCILLADDLGSELDKSFRRKLASIIRRLDCQVFFTATDATTANEFWSGAETSLFHVEHGLIRPETTNSDSNASTH